MIDMLRARWLLLKVHRGKIFFWLLTPIFITIAIVYLLTNVSEDFRIPVAVVTEEKSVEADKIIDGLEESEYISIEHFDGSEKDIVLRDLEQYQYDSVLVFDEGFQDKITTGERRDMVETYYTDRSFAYSTVKELLASLIQESLNQLRITEQIQEMEMEFLNVNNIKAEEVLATKAKIDEDINLVSQNFTFQGEATEADENNTLNPWLIWSYITILATVFAFDFVTRETLSDTKLRFTFLKYSFKSFMLLTLVTTTLVMYLVDLSAMYIFRSMFEYEMSPISLLIFRLITNISSFMIAYYSASNLSLYRNGLLTGGLLIGLHAVMPYISLSSVHPVIALLEQDKNPTILIGAVLILALWMGRNRYVRS